MKLEHLLQIGIVTGNLQETIAAFEAFGLTGWQPLTFRPDTIPNMMQDGKPGDLAFDGAVTTIDGVEYELIQPISEGVLMDYLRTHGPGVHHLAYRPVGGYDSFMEEYRAKWGAPLLEIYDAGRHGGFGYLNTMDKLGFNVEIHLAAPGKPKED